MGRPKMIKTDVDNVYRFEEDGKTYYAYRLISKNKPKIDTWVQYEEIKNADGKTIKQRFTKPIQAINASETKRKIALAEEIARAKEEANRKSVEVVNGVIKPNDQRNFRVLCEWVLANMQKAETTKIRYKRIYQNHFAKYEYNGVNLIDIPTCDISIGVLESFLKDCQSLKYAKSHGRDKAYKREYIVSFYKLILLVYGYSQRFNLITPELYVKLSLLKFPKENDNNIQSDDNEVNSEKIRVLTDEQIKSILPYMKENYPNLYITCLIALNSGTRTAEAFAVRFSDFDYDNQILNIHAQIVSRAGGRYLYVKPKTTKRKVSVSKELCDIVKERQLFMEEQRRKDKEISNKITPEQRAKGLRSPMEANTPIFYEDDADNIGFVINDLISTDELGKFLFYTGSFKKPAKEIREKFVPNEDGKEDFSFYTFRKTHLSIMADSGIPPQALAKRAGHSRIETLYKNYYGGSEQSDKAMMEVAHKIGKEYF